MKIVKFPDRFTKENGIYIHDGFKIPKDKEKLDDCVRYMLDISRMRLFNTWEFSNVLRYWIAMEWMKEQFIRRTKGMPRVLDLGCSWSQLYHMWHRNGNYMKRPSIVYYGIDAHHKRLLAGKEMYKKKKGDKTKHILFDLRRPIVFEKKFDVIVCMEVIEHIGKKATARLLRTIKRNLRDDGLVIMSSPNPLKHKGEKCVWGEDSKRLHKYEYSFKQACELFREHGFYIGTFLGLGPRKGYRTGNSSNKHVRWLDASLRASGIPLSVFRNILCCVDNISPWNEGKQWMVKLYGKNWE